MIEREKKDYIKSPHGQIEKVCNKWIVGYARCPSCRKWLSIGVREINDDGSMNTPLLCSVCRLHKYYKLIGWDK